MKTDNMARDRKLMRKKIYIEDPETNNEDAEIIEQNKKME